MFGLVTPQQALAIPKVLLRLPCGLPHWEAFPVNQVLAAPPYKTVGRESFYFQLISLLCLKHWFSWSRWIADEGLQ